MSQITCWENIKVWLSASPFTFIIRRWDEHTPSVFLLADSVLKHLKMKVKHNPKYIVVFPGNYVWSQYSDFSNKHHQTQWANLWQHIHWLTLNMSLQCFKCFILNLQLRGNFEGNISKCVRRRLKSVSQICSRW